MPNLKNTAQLDTQLDYDNLDNDNLDNDNELFWLLQNDDIDNEAVKMLKTPVIVTPTSPSSQGFFEHIKRKKPSTSMENNPKTDVIRCEQIQKFEHAKSLRPLTQTEINELKSIECAFSASQYRKKSKQRIQNLLHDNEELRRENNELNKTINNLLSERGRWFKKIPELTPHSSDNAIVSPSLD